MVLRFKNFTQKRNVVYCWCYGFVELPRRTEGEEAQGGISSCHYVKALAASASINRISACSFVCQEEEMSWQ